MYPMVANPTYCFAAAEEDSQLDYRLNAQCPLPFSVQTSPAHTLPQLNLPFDPPALVQQPPVWEVSEGFSPTDFGFMGLSSGVFPAPQLPAVAIQQHLRYPCSAHGHRMHSITLIQTRHAPSAEH